MTYKYYKYLCRCPGGVYTNSHNLLNKGEKL